MKKLGTQRRRQPSRSCGQQFDCSGGRPRREQARGITDTSSAAVVPPLPRGLLAHPRPLVCPLPCGYRRPSRFGPRQRRSLFSVARATEPCSRRNLRRDSRCHLSGKFQVTLHDDARSLCPYSPEDVKAPRCFFRSSHRWYLAQCQCLWGFLKALWVVGAFPERFHPQGSHPLGGACLLR